MICDAMLPHMLDADPGELLGHGDTLLAAHIRGCARCRAVGAQVAADTVALMGELQGRASVPRRVRSQRRGTVIAAGALAAAALLATAIWISPPLPPAPPSATGSTSAPLVPAVVLAPPVAVIAPSHARTALPYAPLGHPLGSTAMLVAQQFPTAQPVPPERLGGGPAASPRRARVTIHVYPPAGVRAAVLRTANPTITVVWLY